MLFQLCVICAILIICDAGVIHYPEHPVDVHVAKDYYAYPKYKFSYGVKDPYTGDNKSQYEERDGDKVTGSYQVVDPDGTIRTVTYTADDHNGFIANVDKAGVSIHPEEHIPKKTTVSVFAAEPYFH